MLEELTQQIETKLNLEGDKVFVAFLSNLDNLFDSLNINQENRELYRNYIISLFNYVRVKKLFVKANRVCQHYRFTNKEYKKSYNLQFILFQAKRNKDLARNILKNKNLPYKFLHPDFWDNLYIKEQETISRYA